MTRAEEIEIMEKTKEVVDACHQKAFDMVLKALNQYYKDLSNVYKDTITKLTKAVSEQAPKIGHWIKKDDDGETYFECSKCGDSWTVKVGTPLELAWNYCPNCGCRMESEGKE